MGAYLCWAPFWSPVRDCFRRSVDATSCQEAASRHRRLMAGSVLSLPILHMQPIPPRLLLAAQPELFTPMLQVVQRVVTRHLLDAAGLKADEGLSPHLGVDEGG